MGSYLITISIPLILEIAVIAAHTLLASFLAHRTIPRPSCLFHSFTLICPGNASVPKREVYDAVMR